MSKEPLVSVIIPVFNVQEYLYECLDSVDKQTYSNFEVILVNDGSTDNSTNICREFCEKNSRFSLYNQENSGISVARNNGLNNSKGELIIFVDGDDKVDELLLEHAVELLTVHDVDVLIFSYCVLENGNLKKSPYADPNLGRISSVVALNQLFNGKFGNYLWKQLVKKDIYIDNGIEFPVGRQFEDVATTYKLLGNARSIYMISDKLYIYRQRSSSITHTHSDKDIYGMLKTFSEINQFIDEKFPKLKSISLNYEFNMIFMLIIRMGKWDTNLNQIFVPLESNQKQYIIKLLSILERIYTDKNNIKIYKQKQYLKLFLLKYHLFPLSIAIKSFLRRIR